MGTLHTNIDNSILRLYSSYEPCFHPRYYAIYTHQMISSAILFILFAHIYLLKTPTVNTKFLAVTYDLGDVEKNKISLILYHSVEQDLLLYLDYIIFV